MAYKGRVRPTIALTADDIAADAVGSSEIAAGAVDTAEIATNAVTANEIAAGAVAASEIAATFDISSKTVTLPAASVTAHVTAFEDTPLRRDIATLALQSAIASNQAAYNLSNAFVDIYQDDTGIDAETTMDRDSSEYMTSIVPAGPFGGIDSNVVLMMHFDGANDANVWLDSSTSPHTFTRNNNAGNPMVLKTAIKKFGTASAWREGNSNVITTPDHADWDFAGGDFTVEMWIYQTTDDNDGWVIAQSNADTNTSWGLHIDVSTNYLEGRYNYNSSGGNYDFAGTTAVTNDTWHHIAYVRDGNNLYTYLNGVQEGTQSVASQTTMYNSTSPLNVGAIYDYGNSGLKGYIDELRVSKGICRYPGGTTFTPQTTAFAAETLNATGNYTSATQTASATVSKMGIIVLYKNNAGTNTLNTDLVASISSNGGTNYQTVTLAAGGTFSTGILIAQANDITVTNTGTAPKFKIAVANQSQGSKEAQIHGVALLY